MTKLSDRLAFILGRKSLYDLHPELLHREHLTSGGLDSSLSAEASAGPQVYCDHVWVNKAVSVLADNIASVPVEVLDRQGEVREGHPVSTLLDNNPVMPSSDLWRMWTVQMMLGGEVGFEFVKSKGGQMLEIWPRAGTEFDLRIEKRSAYRRPIEYEVDAGTGKPYPVPLEEFCQFKFYNPVEPLRGMAPLTAVRMGVSLDVYAQQWSRQFFRQGAIPPYAIITPQGITKSERERLESEFGNRMSGIANAHKPAILEEGVTDIKVLSFPPKDIEWVKQREMAREEIGSIFGVPDEIMGWGKDTYENFRMALNVLWTVRLVPLCEMRDITLSEWLRRNGYLAEGETVATDLSGVHALQEDKSAKLAAGVAAFATGMPWSVIDEVLDIGLPDFEGIDQGYLPMSLVEVGAPKPEPAPVVIAPPAAPPETPEEPVPEEPVKAKAWAYEWGSEAHKAAWLLFKAGTENREKGLARIVKRSFEREKATVTGAVRGGERDVGRVLPLEAARTAWIKDVKAYWIETVIAGGQHGAQQLKAAQNIVTKPGVGISFDVTQPGIAEAIRRMLFAFANDIIAYTRDILQKIITQGAEEGWSIPRLVERLTEEYTTWSEGRAERIARTETIKAFNYGSHEQYKAEAVERKAWLSAIDERTRTSPWDHVSANGEEVDIDKPFRATGEELEFPGDPSGDPGNIINCRCTILPIVKI